jgi:hypothetical protein
MQFVTSGWINNFIRYFVLFVLVFGRTAVSGLAQEAGDDVIIKWEKVSGPGEAIFEDDTDPDTLVRFTQPGTYVLRLKAITGDKEVVDDVEVVVDPGTGGETGGGTGGNTGGGTGGNTGGGTGGNTGGGTGGNTGGGTGGETGGGTGGTGGNTGGGTTNPPPAPQNITWPIEVLGPDGTVEEVSFNIPNAADASAAQRAWFKIHNLTYDNKMSWSLNGGGWIPVQEANVEMRPMDHIAGGIGGGHSTIAFSTSLPAGSLRAGTNTIRFRFASRPAERSSGFRVLKFNFLRADGSRIIPENTFIEDNPLNWKPVLSSAADIAEGARLWREGNLTHPAFPAGHIIRAKCADCHAENGRDLKYFNYSNKSIVARSMFHGLTQKQGQQIASYIRTLDLPASVNGRPWNPPYQPGPGLDSRGTSEWAAGAGEEAVLNNFDEMYPILFPEAVEPNGTLNPNKITGAQFSINREVNFRETPIPLQFPDWNSWLPSIHPVDSTGDFFLNHRAHTAYRELKARPPRTASKDQWGFFQVYVTQYTKLDSWPNGFPGGPSSNLSATPRHSVETYDAALWAMTKSWEVMQDKDLETYSKEYFSKLTPISEPRGWFTNMPFFASPNMLALPKDNHGIRDGTPVTRFYYAYIWYHVQAVLFSGQGLGVPISPVDWGYVYGFVTHMQMESGLDSSKHPFRNPALYFLWVAKAIQLSNNGLAPNTANEKAPRIDWASPVRMLGSPGIEHKYYTDEALYRESMEVLTRMWLNLVEKWTPDQWQNDIRVSSSTGFQYPRNVIEMRNLYYSMNTLKELFYMSNRFREIGMPASVNQRMKAVFQPIYRAPGIPWDNF